MSEPEITVRKLSHYAFVTAEDLEDAPGFSAIVQQALKDALDPTFVPPKPWEGEPITPKPAGHLHLVGAVRQTPLLAELVEMHGPVPWSVHTDGTVSRWECEGCDADGYDWEHPTWPCRTSELIAERLGVDLES